MNDRTYHAGPTTILETLRLDVRRRSVGEIVSTIIALLDRQQRGWRVTAIEVTIEKPVLVRGATHRPHSSPAPK